MLISVDIGDTLGRFDPPGAQRMLGDLSPYGEAMIAEVDRSVLHQTPELTDDVIDTVCDKLLIDRHRWPRSWPTGGFTAFPYAQETLAKLARMAPIVALSNVSVLGGKQRMRDVREQLHPHLGAIYTSYNIAARKPQKYCWKRIASEHWVPVHEIVHIGDRIPEDVLGAVRAGCRAILTNTRGVPIPHDVLADQRVAVVDDLRGVPTILEDWTRRTKTGT